jgi:formate hydrogenlyase subunit 3/multisubunit Na+/H+ antiporter MnhD subunit
MMLPMVILAAACVVIGVYPGTFMFMALKAVAALNLGYGRIPVDPFAQMSANITLAATLFVVFFLAITGTAPNLVPRQNHRPFRYLGLWIHSAHNTDAIHRNFLCRFDSGIF